MRDSWTKTALGHIARLTIGKTPPRNAKKYWTDDLLYPFCTIADMDGKWIKPRREGVTNEAIQGAKARLVTKGSLMMSFKLTIGRVGFAAVDLFPNEAIVAIDVDPSHASEEFLFLLLGHQDLTHGSGRAIKGATLNSKSLAAIPVVLPSLLEQQRIVDVINAVDAYVTTLQQQAEAARIARHALLHELLNTVRGDWTEATLGHVMTLGKSGAWGADEPEPGLVQAYCLRGTDLAKLIEGKHPVAPKRWLKSSELTKARCTENMILIETSGTCGRSVLLTQKALSNFDLPVVFSNFCRILQINSERLIEPFAELWLSHAYSTGLIPSYRRITAMPNLDVRSLLNNELIHLPPVAEQQRIVGIAATVDEAIRAAERAVTETVQLRSGLLAELLSGEHEIPEAYDRLLGAA